MRTEQMRLVNGPINNIAEWPSAANFAAALEPPVSAGYVHRLIRTGVLAVIETQLGYLLEPTEARDYAQKRKQRLQTYRGRPGPRARKHQPFRLLEESSSVEVEEPYAHAG